MAISSSIGTFLVLDDALQRGHRIPVKLNSSSLAPLAYSGEILVVVRVDPKRLHLGDLIVFESGEGLIAQRIVYKTQSGRLFQTASQEAFVAGAWIPDGLLMGRVVEIWGDCLEGASRRVPGWWAGLLWAWKTRIRYHLHRLRKKTHP